MGRRRNRRTPPRSSHHAACPFLIIMQIICKNIFARRRLMGFADLIARPGTSRQLRTPAISVVLGTAAAMRQLERRLRPDRVREALRLCRRRRFGEAAIPLPRWSSGREPTKRPFCPRPAPMPAAAPASPAAGADGCHIGRNRAGVGDDSVVPCENRDRFPQSTMRRYKALERPSRIPWDPRRSSCIKEVASKRWVLGGNRAEPAISRRC